MAGTESPIDERQDGAVRLSELIDDLEAVVWEADPETLTFRFVNRRAVELLGYPRSDWYAPDFWAERLIHPEDRSATIASCRAAVRGLRDHRIEYRALRADGGVVWLRDLIRVVPDDAGGARALRGVMLDITTEKALAAHYDRLVSTSPNSVFVLDTAGRIVEVNAAIEELLGYTPDEALGMEFGAFVAPAALPEAGRLLADLLQGRQQRIETDLPVRHRSGALRLFHVVASAMVVEGSIVGVHGVAHDLTEERAVLARQRLLAGAFDDLPDAVSITDRSMRVLYTNRAHAELLGYDRDEAPADILGFTPDDESRAQLEEIRRALELERRWSGRMRRKCADGSVLMVSANVFAVSDGEQEYAITVMRDAADEIARDQHLRRVERLASLGTLIGGVAHELNNPLTAVVGFANLMLLDEHDDDDRETLQTMAREAERAARIVADLRIVTRNTQEAPDAVREAVDLNEVVRHVLRVRRYSIETRSIELREELAPDLPRVHGNRAQLEQVVVNIVVNAEHALDKLRHPPRLLTLRTRATSRRVVLSVRDNGAGIRPEHLERIFDPFFTTKPPGEGTGLGLSLVHSIVADHGGTLRAESEPGGGAAFVVELPIADHHDGDDDADEATTIPPAARRLNVLVVDDEEAVRDLIGRVLRRRGHVVLEAREGTEALERIADRTLAIDLIVSDIHMPGLDGRRLLDALRDRRPDLARRLVFITGDAAPAPPALAELGVEVPVLLKPFELDQVVTLIEGRAR